MKDYERITQKQGEPKIVSKRVYYRLRELEDKIENGDLISTSDIGDNEIEFFVKHNADVRKETVREILNAVDNESNGQTISITNYLRKKYGVEVEEWKKK